MTEKDERDQPDHLQEGQGESDREFDSAWVCDWAPGEGAPWLTIVMIRGTRCRWPNPGTSTSTVTPTRPARIRSVLGAQGPGGSTTTP